MKSLRRFGPSLLAITLPLTVWAQASSLQPPFGSVASQNQPLVIIAVIIQVLLGITGAAALLVFVWGGLHMIFSGGNEEKISKGRSAVVWATIGLLVILSSYGVLQFLFSVFTAAATAQTPA